MRSQRQYQAEKPKAFTVKNSVLKWNYLKICSTVIVLHFYILCPKCTYTNCSIYGPPKNTSNMFFTGIIINTIYILHFFHHRAHGSQEVSHTIQALTRSRCAQLQQYCSITEFSNHTSRLPKSPLQKWIEHGSSISIENAPQSRNRMAALHLLSFCQSSRLSNLAVELWHLPQFSNHCI